MRRTAVALPLIWSCFLIRGFFYSTIFPLWEGYDEPSHFAFVQHLAAHGDLPTLKTPLSLEVEQSMQEAPLPWMLRELPAPHVTHDDYWKRPPAEREQRQHRFRSLPAAWAVLPGSGTLLIHEAQQAPLYYRLLSGPLRALARAPLPDRALLLRWLSVGLASLVIPLGFLVARRVFGDDAPALAAVALVAAMPGLMSDVCRVGNESLAIPLYTVLLYLALRLADGPRLLLWLAMGVTLGLGLLTKAYFLASLPALAVTGAYALRRSRSGRIKLVVQACAGFVLAGLIAGWWYWRARQLTGAWSGQPWEAAVAKLSPPSLLARALEVNWYNAIDSTLVSHIWFGNWSFLQVRSWMYHFFEYVLVAALAGLLALAWRLWKNPETAGPPRPGHLLTLAAFYGFFWMGLAYQVLIMFVSHGVSATTGWFMYCLVIAEVILATLGLSELFSARWRRWILPAATFCFVALELYGTHFLLIPYYTGLIAHRANGALEAFHLSRLDTVGLETIGARLLINKPVLLTAPLLLGAWFLFLAATIGLVTLSARAGFRKD